MENMARTLEALEPLGWMFGILVIFLLARRSSSSNSQAIIDYMTDESSGGQQPVENDNLNRDRWEFEYQKIFKIYK